MRSQILSQSRHVLEGGISDRDPFSNRGSLALLSQGETQGFQWCEVADDPVVVLKFQPVKAGNRRTEQGSPQGGVISPLIANVYLDAFDREMRRRKHRIVRYADDILILCCSKAAAENARRVATSLLEKDLKLTVNQSKTHIAYSDDGVRFLGIEIMPEKWKIRSK